MATKKVVGKTFFFGITIDSNEDNQWDLSSSKDDVSHFEYIVEIVIPSKNVVKDVRKVSFI